MANYPNTLPAPLLDSYDLNKQVPFIRTEMETGIARQRRRFRATPVEVNYAVFCVGSQMTDLLTFYDTTLSGGTAYFSMTLDLGNGAQTYNQVRFKDGLQQKKMGPQQWRVTSKLEVIV